MKIASLMQIDDKEQHKAMSPINTFDCGSKSMQFGSNQMQTHKTAQMGDMS